MKKKKPARTMSRRVRVVLRDEVVSAREYAAMHGVHKITVRKWIERGKLEAIKRDSMLLLQRNTPPPRSSSPISSHQA
ncbi:MAG: hypothetical protein QME66_04235 [Candidatus Eisenbacteria bacterium]|nr:hypothetical protein [Candidatus Eisenbacteria bacterium]